MIAITTGKTFLKVYNEKAGVGLSAKEFFDQKYFKLFFDHSKYFQWVKNSPFVQMKKGQKPNNLSEGARKEKLENLHNKIASGVQDGSVAIGFSASEEKEYATTSGQVTDLSLPITNEDIYYSWIGSGLGIGVSGGLSILFNRPEILFKVYEGWYHYREYLNDPAYDKLRPNQINTWNGQWIAHVLSRDYDELNPLVGFDPFDKKKDSGLELKTQSWVKVLLGIARVFPQDITGYVYNLGQTNKTIGFINFVLPQIRRPIELYKKIFKEDQYLKDTKEIENLYGTAYGFQRACQQGAIGVQALEPKGLRDLIPGKKDETKLPNYQKADEKQHVSFRTYQTWLLAMLNNDQLWDTAGEAAQAFLLYKKGAKEARTDRINNVNNVLEASYKRPFISALTKLIEEIKEPDEKSKIEDLGKIVNSMPDSNVSYFVTLIRFRYASLSNK